MFLETQMVWATKVEYGEVIPAKPAPVKKQVWDGEKFVLLILHRQIGVPNREQELWLEKTYGLPGIYKNGSYWDYSVGGNFTVMDEKVYSWYQIKWGNK